MIGDVGSPTPLNGEEHGAKRRLPLRLSELFLIGLVGVVGIQILGATAVARGWLDLTDRLETGADTIPRIFVVVVLLALQSGAMLFVVYIVAVRWRKITWRELGFRSCPARWYWHAVLVVAAGFGLSAINGMALETLFGEVPENPQLQVIAPDGFSWTGMIAMALVAGFIVPVVEEVTFRGVLYRWLRERIGFWAGIMTSSVLFGLLHGILFLAPVLAILGALFALLYERSGSLWPAIAAHGLFNGVMVAGVYIGIALS